MRLLRAMRVFPGVIFMHDLSNARSYDHLKAWNRYVLSPSNPFCRVSNPIGVCMRSLLAMRIVSLRCSSVRKAVCSPHPPRVQANIRRYACFRSVMHNSDPSFSSNVNSRCIMDVRPQLNALPKLVIGNKRDTVKAHAKRTPALPELRNVDSIESVRTAPIISSSVLFLHSHSGALLHPRSHQSAEPYALEPTAFHGFLDRVVAFANTSSSGFGDSHAGEHTSGFLSPFSEGLRQMKSKPVGNSPLAASGPPLSSGSGGSARSWWK